MDDPFFITRIYERYMSNNGWTGRASVVLVYARLEFREAITELKARFPDAVAIWDLPSWQMRPWESIYIGFEVGFRTAEERLAAALSLPHYDPD